MIKVFLTTGFVKQHKKLPLKIQEKFFERVALFKKNPRHPSLRVHKLKGDMEPFESMSITGDLRTLFIREGANATFHKIGTHSELY